MKRMFMLPVAAMLAAAPALADPVNGFYAGGQLGYNDVGDFDLGPDSVGVDGFVYGGYAGFNVRMTDTFFVGTEGSYNFGTGSIDGDYGITAQAGFAPTDQYAFFGRFGYQWIDLDIGEIAEDIAGTDLTDDEEDAIEAAVGDDTDDGFLFGLGGQFALSPNVSLRGTVDTIEFDTYRLQTGITFHF